MIHGNGGGTNAKGFYDTSLLDALRRGRTSDPGNLSTTVTLVALLGEYMQKYYGGRYYAKAQEPGHPPDTRIQRCTRQLRHPCHAYDADEGHSNASAGCLERRDP